MFRRDSHKGLVFAYPAPARAGWLDRNRDALTVALVTGLVVTVIGGLILAALTVFLSTPPPGP